MLLHFVKKNVRVAAEEGVYEHQDTNAIGKQQRTLGIQSRTTQKPKNKTELQSEACFFPLLRRLGGWRGKCIWASGCKCYGDKQQKALKIQSKATQKPKNKKKIAVWCMLLHLVKKIGWVKRKVCMSIGVANAMEVNNNRGYSKFNLGPTQKTKNCEKREA